MPLSSQFMRIKLSALFYLKFWIFTDKPVDIVLILHSGKCTCRVYQSPARLEHCRRLSQYLSLNGSKILRSVLSVRIQNIPVLSEHALSGAGCVHQYPVKEFGIYRGKLIGLRTCYDSIGYTGELYVLQQCLCSRCARIIGIQAAPLSQITGYLRAFSSRRRAQIQHHIVRLHIKPGHRSHGRGLLYIIQTRIIKRMSGKVGYILYIESVFDPRYLLMGLLYFIKNNVGTRLQSIDSYPECRSAGKRPDILFEILAELIPHRIDERFRQFII